HFMAETADILADENQKVILPNMAAGCSMADMANLFQVRKCWAELERVVGAKAPVSMQPNEQELIGATAPAGSIMHLTERQSSIVTPVTYINSAANLKAFVGERGGTVCTSTNAPTAVKWALEQGDKVLFFPDQHLGRNTGVKLGYDPDKDMVLWDPFKPLGGN